MPPGTTLNNTIHVGITLGTGQTSSPYMITSHGAIDPTNGAAYGLYADTSLPSVSVNNAGLVMAGTSGTAIKFDDIGYLTNSGRIEGASAYPGTGVYMAGGGTLTNTKTGDITAYRIAVHGISVAATVDNAGTIAGDIIGVRLSGGGLVSNSSGGTITGEYAVQGHINASTVINSGTITGQYNGVGLYGGQIINLAGGTISESTSTMSGLSLKAAAYINDGTGTITNDGIITGYYGAALLTGGLITNASSGTITGSSTSPGTAAYINGGTGTIMNAGLLQAYNAAVLKDGGTITNATGATITGSAAVQIFGAAGYISNSGLLSGRVQLGDYGAVTNASGGIIDGAVILEGGTLTNSGQISASVDDVSGEDPVTIFNNTGAKITGGEVGIFLFAGGSVTNAGTISGTAEAILARGGAVIVNQAGGDLSNSAPNTSAIYFQTGAGNVSNAGTIKGGLDGIDLANGGTVANAGTIIGSGGTAVQFSGTADSRLILSPGAVFEGVVAGGAGTNTLELASGTPGQTGIISALAAQYTGFTQIQLDDGANWAIGSAGPSTDTITFDGNGTLTISGTSNVAAAIEDFVSGDTIALSGFSAASKTFAAGGLTLSNGVTSETLNIAGTYATADFTISADGPNGTYITTDIPCFAAGTHIATPSGETPVEALKIGELVSTLNGPRPINWIGHRFMNLAQLQNPESGYLVRICKGAFAGNLPHRDLLVTQEHCIFINGGLIPARMLVNDRSIFIDRTIRNYTYYHVELAEHAILLAENLPTESYLDTGNRGNFVNAAIAGLQQDFAINQVHKNWANAAAPLTTDSASVEPIWQKLHARAEDLGIASQSPAPDLTADPDLRIETDSGEIVWPVRKAGGKYLFMLRPGADRLRLLSRTARPSDTIGPFIDDRRDLGVLVGDITIHDGRRKIPVTTHLATADLAGWFGLDNAPHRWTNGEAKLTLALDAICTPAVILEIQVVQAGLYRIDMEIAEAMNAA